MCAAPPRRRRKVSIAEAASKRAGTGDANQLARSRDRCPGIGPRRDAPAGRDPELPRCRSRRPRSKGKRGLQVGARRRNVRTASDPARIISSRSGMAGLEIDGRGRVHLLQRGGRGDGADSLFPIFGKTLCLRLPSEKIVIVTFLWGSCLGGPLYIATTVFSFFARTVRSRLGISGELSPTTQTKQLLSVI